MKHAIALWDRFWFEPRTTQALGLYRIALAVATACWLLHYLPDAAVFFSDQGLLRPETIREHDRFNLSAFLFTSSHPALVWGTLGVGLGLALALGLGLRPRLCAFLLFLVLLSLQARNRFLLNGGDVLLRTGLFWLALSPAGGGASYSLRPQSGLRATCWVQRMIQIQLVVIYVSTALWKWHSPEWQSGTAMYYVSSLVNHQVQGAELLLNFPQLCVFLTYLVLAVETLLGPLLLIPQTRRYALVVGVGLHLWILVSMTIPMFSLVTLAMYPAFLSEADVESLKARWTSWRLGRA